MTHAGGCHCGAVRFTFDSDKPLAPRACQCGFCRRHGARSVSDPDGSVTLSIGPGTLRYRFGLGITDFLICGRCGSYVAALAELDGRRFAVLNLNAFDDPHPALTAAAFSYEGETAESRSARRRARWTPARLI